MLAWGLSGRFTPLTVPRTTREKFKKFLLHVFFEFFPRDAINLESMLVPDKPQANITM